MTQAKRLREEATALKKLQRLAGMWVDGKDRLRRAYRAYHSDRITKRQARFLGCSIK